MKKSIGYTLVVCGGLAFAAILVLAAIDIFGSVPNASSAGECISIVIGTVASSLLLFTLATALAYGGLVLVAPQKYSYCVHVRRVLRGVYAKEQLNERKLSPTDDELNYSSESDTNLCCIYRSIKQERAPYRHQALLSAIKQRVECDFNVRRGE